MSEAAVHLLLELPTGTVKIALRPDLAPKHVERITTLVKDGFYNGKTFHRVVEGFVAQGGCPHGTGTGGTGVKLRSEFNDEPHSRGAVSMARTQDPHSADCQFFICLDDVNFLDGQYTVWGRVVEGIEHVDALPKGEPPREPGQIVSAIVEATAA
jgi:peptidylprolyl isomerase